MRVGGDNKSTLTATKGSFPFPHTRQPASFRALSPCRAELSPDRFTNDVSAQGCAVERAASSRCPTGPSRSPSRCPSRRRSRS
eukprot:scaffold56056_cov45-Phaeocystis_antarctica.AAC.2